MSLTKKKWSLNKLEESLRLNVKDYGSAIAVAFLFKRIYGRYPKIGLSGAQAGLADRIYEVLPNPQLRLKP
jgi:hypothetical protein